MREQLGPEGAESLRPKASRIDGERDDHRGTAAAAGRLDALDAESVLGLQRAAGNAAVSDLLNREEDQSPVHDVINSPGRPLDDDVRTDMESRLGADFGDVRVHNDSAANDSATAVNAHAYTVGSNIVFQRDHYDPSSTQGRTTLAHELTHVIQQRSGPVDGTAAAGGIKISDPSDRFEREASANADRVMSAPAPVQREEAEQADDQEQEQEPDEEQAPEPEEEPAQEPDTSVQGLFMQREEAEDDDEDMTS